MRSLAAFEPEMFLYDEPTSGLDPVNADTICKLILELSTDGRGFMIVTHKVPDAFKVANRFMFLRNGSILFDGKKEQLIRFPDPEIQIFLSEADRSNHSSLVDQGVKHV
jgi:ABC-type transporter Mla maintaining outer membrane lipid asymmetry ATPase subunit MlaF